MFGDPDFDIVIVTPLNETNKALYYLVDFIKIRQRRVGTGGPIIEIPQTAFKSFDVNG